MRDINSFTVSGNITRQPEITQLPSGTDVLKLRVAVNTRRKQGEDKANYFDCEIWGGAGALLKKVMADGTDLKGHRVLIAGELDYQEWQDRDTQQTRSKTVLKVAPNTGTVSYEGPPRGRQQPHTNPSAASAAQTVPAAPMPGTPAGPPAPPVPSVAAAGPAATADDLPF
jgi:single-strand DNA-binding protein